MSKDIRSYFKAQKQKDIDSDVIPESPDVQIKNKKKVARRKRVLIDDSDEEIFSPKKIKAHKGSPENVLNKKKEKSPKKLKEIKSVGDLFGTGSIKRSEPLVKKEKKKTETGIHSDDEFEKSLLQLDEIEDVELSKSPFKNNVDNKEILQKCEIKKERKSKSKEREEKSLKNECDTSSKEKETYNLTDSKSPLSKSNNDKSQNIPNIKIESKVEKEKTRSDFSEFIEDDNNINHKEEEPKAKKRKLDKSLNESVLTDEERQERRLMSAALYKNYLNRSGPKHLGSKEIPEGSSDCLNGCAFVLTGVLDSFEKDDVAAAIAKFGGCVKSAVTKKVTHVIAGEDAGPAKMAKAQELGIKIINEDEFLQMIIDLTNNKDKVNKSDVKEIKQIESAKKSRKNDKSPINKNDDTRQINKNHDISKPLETKNKIKSSPSKLKIKKENGDECKNEQVQNQNGYKSRVEDVSCKSNFETKTSDEAIEQNLKQESSGLTKSCNIQTPNCILWVDKYKPQSTKQIIGQHGDASNVKKLCNWLTKWYANRKAKLPKPNPWAKNDDGAYYKAALLSGPPGVGKTTTVGLVCKELGFDMVEFNASDTRNKTLIKAQIGELLTTTTLSAYAKGDTGKQAVTKKHVLVMDEVDGMAGNEDRGGLQELIGLIKSTSVPIICMCNDRNSQKMRSLVNYCYDLRFNRPRVDQIKSAMMSICHKERIKVPQDVLSQLISAAGQDVRQTLHLLSIWAADPQLADADRLRTEAKAIKKDMKLGPWEAVRKVFTSEEHKTMSIHDKSDLFFYDYSLAPLFVQENYLHVVPHCPKNEVLQRISMAADSISLGDLVEARIRGSQSWNLLPVQAMYSSVIPGNAMAGHVGGQIQFPGWLGKNSRANKIQRLGQEIHAHTRLSTSGSKSSIFLDYCTYLRDAIVTPLLKDKSDGISQSMDVLESYHLLREDLESLIELSLWPGQRNPTILIDSKVKAAMTRTYNKRASALPYAPGAVRKTRARDDNELGDDDADDEPASDESDPENDALIKKKKNKEAEKHTMKAVKSNEKPSASKKTKKK